MEYDGEIILDNITSKKTVCKCRICTGPKLAVVELRVRELKDGRVRSEILY